MRNLIRNLLGALALGALAGIVLGLTLAAAAWLTGGWLR